MPAPRDRGSRPTLERLAIEQDRSGLCHDSRDRAQQSRLAGAVATEQRHEPPSPDDDVDAMEGFHGPVARPYPADFKNGGGHAAIQSSPR